jgi:DNA-binding ferritin-like protein
MDANILCTLLAQRIPPEQFQVHGLEVVFFDPEKNNKPVGTPNESPYDTPENRAIVADVIKNYDTLAGDIEKSMQEAVNTPNELTSVIDSMARWIALQADPPKTLTDYLEKGNIKRAGWGL